MALNADHAGSHAGENGMIGTLCSSISTFSAMIGSNAITGRLWSQMNVECHQWPRRSFSRGGSSILLAVSQFLLKWTAQNSGCFESLHIPSRAKRPIHAPTITCVVRVEVLRGDRVRVDVGKLMQKSKGATTGSCEL